MNASNDTGGQDRAGLICGLIEQMRAAREGGGVNGDAAMCAAHPELMPELGQELEKLRRVEAAGRAAGEESLASAVQLSTAWAAPIQELAGARIGPYKLLQLIGEGGFGSVFMAEQQHPVSRRVALKIIKLGMDTRSVIARFEAERQALAMMDHANIARVLDAGATDSGRPYFVMELVKGDPITEYADRNKLSVAERLDLFTQVCNAVHHAHQKGVIHRDLKPSNILVSTQDGKPFARVIDFGIAKATAARLTEKTVFTEFHQLIGTPQYMSPEQADGSLDIDTRTDVYSLGVLLYELLTGSTPFDARALRSAAYEEMRRMIREVEPPKPSTRLVQSVQTLPSVALNRRIDAGKLGVLVRGELDWIVMKALDKDRARRYDSPSTLAADVMRHIAGEPVLAAPPGAGYRIRKFAHRHRAMLATAITIFALLAGGVLVSSLQALRARRAERIVAGQLGEVTRQKAAAQAANAAAEAAAAKFRQQLSDSYVERGITEWDAHQPSLAALWFVQALKLDRGNAEREEVQRLRIGMSLFFSPRPVDEPVNTTIPESRYKLYVTKDPKPDPAFDLAWRRRVDAFGNYCQVYDRTAGKVITPRMEHASSIHAICFTPDEKLIATVAEDKTLRLWDAATGKIAAPPLVHPNPIWQVCFGKDGILIVTKTENGEVRAWDGIKGTLLAPAVHSDAWIQLSPDESIIATVDANGLHLRSTRSSKEMTLLPPIAGFVFQTVHFSPDGKVLLLVDHEWPGGFCIWNLSHEMKVVPKPYPITDAIFSRDGRLVAVQHPDGIVRVWSTVSGEPLTEELRAGDLKSMKADGSAFLALSGGSYREWDVATGEPASPAFRLPHFARDARFSAEGRLEVVDEYNNAIAWEPPRQGRSYSSASVNQSSPRPLAFAHDGKILLTIGSSGYVQFLEASTFATIAPPLNTFDVRLSADGKKLGVYLNNDLGVFDAATGARLSPRIEWEPEWVHDFEISGDGKILLAVSSDAARVWNMETGLLLSRRPSNRTPMHYQSGFWHGALSRDGKYAAVSGSDDIEMCVWNVATGEVVKGPFTASTDQDRWQPEFLVFGPDDRTLVASDSSGRARAWAIPEGGPVAISKGAEYADAFSADLKRVVRFEGSQVMRVWDTRTARPITRDMDALRNEGYRSGGGPVFSPDGKWVAAWKQGNAAQIYDSATGRPITPLIELGGGEIKTLFSPDSKSLAAASISGKTVLVQLVTNSMGMDDLESLVELLTGRRIDAIGGTVELSRAEWTPRWDRLRKKMPDFFQPPADGSKLDRRQITPQYRAAVAARVAAAKTSEARKLLVESLNGSSDAEGECGLWEHTIFLAETVLAIDPTSPEANENLAWGYLNIGRYDDALAICQKYAGRTLDEGNEDEHVFGAFAFDTIATLRKEGKDQPTLGKIEALIAPTTRPSTRPATQPATQAANP